LVAVGYGDVRVTVGLVFAVMVQVFASDENDVHPVSDFNVTFETKAMVP
jgi:hypothetical protein